MLFAAGTRPTADDVERLLTASPAEFGPAAQVGHRPSDDAGWMELLASGLTYDLRGLAPGGAARLTPAVHVYGLPADIEKFGFEAVLLQPGEHIAAGASLLPIVRNLLGLAAALALELPLTAVCWNPAQTWMDPRYFGRIVVNWLSGGVFPALGLTGLRHVLGGALESSGLTYFIGQEICMPAREGQSGPETMKLAGRLVDHLVRRGPIKTPMTLPGSNGEVLLLEPSADGKHIVITGPA